MSKRHEQLRVDWSKLEKDFNLHWPLGCMTKCDASWLSGIFTKNFENELRRRGYDPTTLRFSVDIDFDGPRASERFSTLLNQRKGK